MKGKRKPVIEFIDFSGGQDTETSIIGHDTKTSPDCMNVYTEGAKLKQREGFSTVNSTTVEGNGNGIYNYVRSASLQVLVALFGDVFKRMDAVGSSWDGNWDTVSANLGNGTGFSDSIIHFVTYEGNLVMTTENRDKPQRMTSTDASHFDLDYGGVGTSPYAKYCEAWKNHLWLMNLSDGYFTDNCTSAEFASWTTNDTATGASDTATEDTLVCYKLAAPALASSHAEIYQDAGTLGGDYQIEIKTKITTMGNLTNDNYVTLESQNGVIKLQTRWADDGLFVYDGAAWNEVAVNLAAESVWNTWKFYVTGGTATAAKLTIFQDGSIKMLQQDCSVADANSDGFLRLRANAATGTATSLFIDYINITKVNSISDYVTDGNFANFTGSTADSWAVAPLQAVHHFRMNDDAANTTVTDGGSSAADGTSSVNTSLISDSAGKIGECFTLSSSSAHYIDTDGVFGNLASDTSGAWSFWMKTETSAKGGWEAMVGFADADANNKLLLTVYPDGNLNLSCEEAAGLNWDLTWSGVIADSATWYHIVVSHDEVEPILYVNTVSGGTFTTSTAKTVWMSGIGGLDNGRIGCARYSTETNRFYYTGLLDDIRFYQTPLSTADIANLYNGGDGTESGAVTSADATTFKIGTYSLQVQEASDGTFISQTIASSTAIAGQACAMGAWIYATNNQTYKFRVDDQTTTHESAEFTGNGAWQYQVHEFTPTAGAGSIDAEILCTSAGTVRVDKVSVCLTGSEAALEDRSDRVQRTAINTYNDFTGNGSGTNDIRTTGDIGITGHFILNDKMYITKKYSIHRFTYTGSTPLVEIKQIISDVGTTSPRTIKKLMIPGKGEVVIYLGSDKNLYMFDGWDRTNLTERMFNDNGLSSVYMKNINGQALGKAHAVVHDELNWYEIFVPLGGSTSPDYSIIYDYIKEALWPNDNRNFSASALCDDGAGVRKVYALTNTSGYCVLTNNSNSDNGTNINSYWTSGKIGDPSVLVKMDEVSMQTESVAAGSVQLSWRMDYETDWTSKTLSASSYDHNYNPKRNQNLAQIKISNNSSDPSFVVWTVRFFERLLGISK